MAIRGDATTDRLLRTGTMLDYNSAYTWMGWIYLTSDLNAIGKMFSLNTNGTTNNNEDLGTESDGTTLRVRANDGGTAVAVTGTNLSVSTWYHVALVRESATSLKAYLNGALDITNTKNITGRTAVTRMEAFAVTTANSNRQDMRVQALKAWQQALTLAEIANEMKLVRPIRSSDVWGWWPCLPGTTERLKDYSGNGRDWTEGGTLTDEDPPGISWGGFTPYSYNAAAGGGDQNSAVGKTDVAIAALSVQANQTVGVGVAAVTIAALNPDTSVGGVNAAVNKTDVAIAANSPQADQTQAVGKCDVAIAGLNPSYTTGGVNAAVGTCNVAIAALSPQANYIQPIGTCDVSIAGLSPGYSVGGVNATVGKCDVAIAGYNPDSVVGTFAEVGKCDIAIAGLAVGYSVGGVNVAVNKTDIVIAALDPSNLITAAVGTCNVNIAGITSGFAVGGVNASLGVCTLTIAGNAVDALYVANVGIAAVSLTANDVQVHYIQPVNKCDIAIAGLNPSNLITTTVGICNVAIAGQGVSALLTTSIFPDTAGVLVAGYAPTAYLMTGIVGRADVVIVAYNADLPLTPDERTFGIASEDRGYLVPLEDRVLEVKDDSRVFDEPPID